MMSRSKIPLLLLIALVGLCSGYEATDDEARKASCGFSELPIHDASDKEKNGPVSIGTSSFLIRVYTVKDDGSQIDYYTATGSYVSPVHVITSAQAVLTLDKKWLLDNSNIKLNCEKDTHMKVPPEYVKNLRVVVGACVGNGGACETSERKVKMAYLLNMCDTTSDALAFERMSRPMILEMDETTQLDGWPCIVDAPIEVKAGDKVRLYGYEFEKDKYTDPVLTFRSSAISPNLAKLFWLVPKYVAHGDRGGPMLGFYEGRWFLLGVGASPGYADNAGDTYFFKTKNFAEALCNHFKICGRTKMGQTLPPRPPSTTEPPPTTIKILEATTTTGATTTEEATFALPQETKAPTPPTTTRATTKARTEAPTTATEPVVETSSSDSSDDFQLEQQDLLNGAVGLGVFSSVFVAVLFLVL